MKHLFTTLFILAFSNSLVNAQCDYRYQQEIFSNVTVTSNIVFGSNTNVSGATTTLKMDIYEPMGDTVTNRPVLIMAHGGSFVGGTKTDADVVAICQSFAKRGYVCCSYEYRLSAFPNVPSNQAQATDAVFRAVQDGKAAVRFMRLDAASTNIYKIDSTQIFLGGSSAGAFVALHLAYLDKPSELPSSVDTMVLGGMEGNSGNPGHSSKVKAIVNLCGALGDKTWIEQNDIPLCSMHGTQDQTVPYDHAMLYMLGLIPIMQVDGSSIIHPYALSMGVDSWYYQWEGADHVPYLSSQLYMDTTIAFVSDFLYHHLNSYVSVIDTIAYTSTIACNAAGTGTIDLTVTATGDTYLWNNGATSEDLTNLNPGSYNVTVTDATGCTTSLVTPVEISFTTPPFVAFTITNASAVGGTDGAIILSTLNGQQPFTFLWSNGATTQDVSNIPAGNYSATVTDANGCTGTAQGTVSEPTGVSEILANGISIYPNPTLDYLVINFNSSLQQSIVQLFDLYGKLIHEYKNISEEKLKIEKGDLSSGTYFLRINNSENSVAAKIIFQ